MALKTLCIASGALVLCYLVHIISMKLIRTFKMHFEAQFVWESKDASLSSWN